ASHNRTSEEGFFLPGQHLCSWGRAERLFAGLRARARSEESPGNMAWIHRQSWPEVLPEREYHRTSPDEDRQRDGTPNGKLALDVGAWAVAFSERILPAGR